MDMNAHFVVEIELDSSGIDGGPMFGTTLQIATTWGMSSDGNDAGSLMAENAAGLGEALRSFFADHLTVPPVEGQGWKETRVTYAHPAFDVLAPAPQPSAE